MKQLCPECQSASKDNLKTAPGFGADTAALRPPDVAFATCERSGHMQRGQAMLRHWYRGVVAVFVVGLLLPAVMMAQPAPAAGDEELSLLFTFRTEPYGFTPDDVTFSPRGGDLLFIASGDWSPPCDTAQQPGRGIYRLTVTGRLVESIPLPAEIADIWGVGYGITIATNGREVGNVYLTDYTGTPDMGVAVLGKDFDFLGEFRMTGTAWPGDAIAYNPTQKTLWVPDVGGGNIVEIGLDGTPIAGPFRTSCAITGLTYNVVTQTFFGVCAWDHKLLEIDSSGVELRSFDLVGYGIEQPVGVAAGHDMLFIADEGDCNNQGIVWVFRSPKKVHRAK